MQAIYDHKLALPLFSKLTYLKIYDWMFFYGADCLENLLAQCVVLKTLAIEERRDPKHRTDKRDRISISRRDIIAYLFQQSRMVGLLCHLKRIKFHLLQVKCGEDEAFMSFLKFFVNNGMVLEELTVLGRHLTVVQRLAFRKELSTLPRVLDNRCRVLVDIWWC